MTGFWTLVGPSCVVFLVLGSVLCWGSLLIVRAFKAYAIAIEVLKAHLEEAIETKTARMAPKRLEELESFCNTLREEFSKLVALNQEWKSDSYRKVQRYATMINKKLTQFDGVRSQPPIADPDVDDDDEPLDAAAVARAATPAVATQAAGDAQEETIESVRAAFYNKPRPF